MVPAPEYVAEGKMCFMVPELMMDPVLVMVPELVMVVPLKFSMPVVPAFDTVMRPPTLLVMVPWLEMPVVRKVLDTVMVPELVMVPWLSMPTS